MKPLTLATALTALFVMGDHAPLPMQGDATAQTSGPWRHAREPGDRRMGCDALEGEITRIDNWQVSQASGTSGPSAEQGARAAEVISRRTGNSEVAGIIGDARSIFGGGNRRSAPRRQPRGRDGKDVAADRRRHLMRIYESKSCWQSADGGYHNEVSQGPWLHPRKPRDRGMSCQALETEVNYVDTWLDEAETRGFTPNVDPDRGLAMAQSTARNVREYETSGVIGDVRSVLNAGPDRRLEPAQEQKLVDTAYLRRSHLMDMYERRACWEQPVE